MNNKNKIEYLKNEKRKIEILLKNTINFDKLIYLMKIYIDIKRELEPVIPKIKQYNKKSPLCSVDPLNGYYGGHRGIGSVIL